MVYLLTVVNPDGTFSGAQYDEIKQEYINHHRKYGQKLIWYPKKLTFDERGNVIEKPAEDDLKNEITVGEDVAQANYMVDLDFRLSMLELGLK